MTNASNATVVSLQSHPVWTAAQRRAQQRKDAMRRHPAFQSRLSGHSSGEGVGAVVIELGALGGGQLHGDLTAQDLIS